MSVLIPQLNHEGVGTLPFPLCDQLGYDDSKVSSFTEATCQFKQLLNRITDNGINQLMGSNLSWLTDPKLIFHICCMLSLFAFYFQLVIEINLPKSQGDPIKPLPLHYFINIWFTGFTKIVRPPIKHNYSRSRLMWFSIIMIHGISFTEIFSRLWRKTSTKRKQI